MKNKIFNYLKYSASFGAFYYLAIGIGANLVTALFPAWLLTIMLILLEEATDETKTN
ncbi:hypothetical protein [Leuconostoc mesenteroides]|uniref:hypothetical protein n=1 Tax=Leuconostoc mesenteroides TaxID=1245 RepID=UPI001CBEA492|nr:hypothetical protein [Leuconostoc mesenteroides]MBZ1530696.1 hypothetical protein [Leuconostoc mesenteroides]